MSNEFVTTMFEAMVGKDLSAGGSLGGEVANHLRSEHERRMRASTCAFAHRCLIGTSDQDVVLVLHAQDHTDAPLIARFWDIRPENGAAALGVARGLQSAMDGFERRCNDIGLNDSLYVAATGRLQEASEKWLLSNHPDLPLPALLGLDDAGRLGFSTAVRARLGGHIGLRVVEVCELISEMAAEIREVSSLGGSLSWFDPEVHSVEPDLAARGYNVLHNRELDLFGPLEDIKRYLDERFVSWNQIVGGKGSGLVARAKLLLKPYLDQELAAEFANYDASDSSYCDDGPTNFREWASDRMLLGEVSDPWRHAVASYCREVRGALMNRGLVGDLEINRLDALAMSLTRNGVGLERLAGYLHAAFKAGGGSPEEIAGYEPVVCWSDGTVAAWQKLGEVTDGLNDNDDVVVAIEGMIDFMHNAFPFDDTVSSETPGHNYAFMSLPVAGPRVDVDHPERVLLREALADLRRARVLLRDVDGIRERADEYRSGRLKSGLAKVLEMRESGRCSSEDLANYEVYVREEFAMVGTNHRDADLYQQVCDQVLQDWSGGGITSFDKWDVLPAGEIVALYDGALRRLAHADYNIRCVLATR